MLSYDAVENQINFSQIEKAVFRAKKEWEATFDAIPDMLLLTNSDGRIARCNHAAAVELRGSYGELVGKRFSQLFPEVDLSKTSGVDLQLFADKRWYRIYNFPVMMGDELIYHCHFFQDVTRKKLYELEILREEQYYEALFMSFPESLAVLDAHGTVRNINPAFESLFGFSNNEAKGHSIQSLLTAREFRVAGKSQTQGSPTAEQGGTFRCVSKEGKALMLSVRELPVTLNGIDHGRLAVFHRVSAPINATVSQTAGSSTLDVLFDRLEGRLLPVLQDIDALTLSLGNDTLSPKQIALKTHVDEQAEQLKQLLAEIRARQSQAAQRSDSSSAETGNMRQPEAQLGASPSPAERANAPKDPSRILLVEDNPINQKLMLRLLQKRGYPVTVADNGIAALRALAKQSYDLIFMDIQMPEMDGIEATRRIRVREQNGQHQVIIALTAEGPAGDRMECLRAGMDDYLAKPVDIDRLFSLLEKYASAAKTLPIQPPEVVVLQCPPESDAINVSAALPRFGGEPEVYFHFLNQFIKQLKQTDQKMLNAYKNGDIEQLHSISHGLKGTAANFEAKTIRDLADSLEEMTGNNTLVGAYSLIQEIRGEIQQVEAFYHNQMLLRKKKTQVLPAGVSA